MSRFVMTASGRIMTRQDYKREQQFMKDWDRYQRMEAANREWLAAQNQEV